MTSDLNAALAKLREMEREVDVYAVRGAAIDFLDAIPEGAVLVAITRDDVYSDGALRNSAYQRLSTEVRAALEAQS